MSTRDMTIDQIDKARADLEKRLRIDIAQFEKDSGCQIRELDLIRNRGMDGFRAELLAVRIEIEVLR